MIGAHVFAPAKVNLCLHVTGQRADGYHLLDSLVVFADVGDTLWIQIGNTLSFTVEGSEAAGVPADMKNLVMKVAVLFKDMPGASFLLTKHLPSASGIGGGSADAAAAYRGLMTFWSGGVVDPEIFEFNRSPMAEQMLALGADLPMCMASSPCRVRGIGDELAPARLPPLHAVLVNPRISVPTPQVFAALETRNNPPIPFDLPEFRGPFHLVEWLMEQRNDLESSACRLFPGISSVLEALLACDGSLMARMSGSGATCFGLFETKHAAERATKALVEAHPDWWVKAAVLGDQSAAGLPKVKTSDKAAFS